MTVAASLHQSPVVTPLFPASTKQAAPTTATPSSTNININTIDNAATVSSSSNNADYELPVIDLQDFLMSPHSPAALTECKRAAHGLKEFGVLIVRDPRVTEQHNDQFLDLMEAYFHQPEPLKMLDARPDFAFQVGSTPAFQETPRCTVDPKCRALMSSVFLHFTRSPRIVLLISLFGSLTGSPILYPSCTHLPTHPLTRNTE